MKIDPNDSIYVNRYIGNPGLTVLTHLSSMAMQGMLSNSYDNEAYLEIVGDYKSCAREAVKYAKALIAEINAEAKQ